MSANLYQLFRDRFEPHRARFACVDAAGDGLSFAELDLLSARFAAALRGRGITPGDRVLAQTEKSVGALALYLGCLRLGAIYVPLNSAYTESELEHFVTDAKPRLWVGARGAADTRPAMALGTPDGTGLWAEALASAPLLDIIPRSAQDGAAIVYTSGTTGRSKGALLSHGNLAANAAALHRIWGFRPGDVLLHALPIFHVHGLFVALHCALLNASTMIFLPRFDANEVTRLLPQATVFMGVPTFYSRLLGLPAFSRESCRNARLFLCGSAPLSRETFAEFEARTGHRILERYGMSETGILTSNPLNGERIAGSVGFPLPEVELRVVDERGNAVAAGVTGAVEVRGPNVFGGYWGRPDAGEFRPDGFFTTGDLGVLDAEQRLSLVGRARDLIISGGLNVYPKEIEDAIDRLPGVVESAVIGIPDSDLGETVAAVVVAAPDTTLDAERLLEALAPQLARFKRPRRILFIDELPRNVMGKVQKTALRAWHDRVLAEAARSAMEN